MATPLQAQDVRATNAGVATLGQRKDDKADIVIGAGATNLSCIGTMLVDASCGVLAVEA